MKASKKLVLFWIIIMFVITFCCSLIYLVTQQSLRLGADEQPAQLATDTAIKLQNGKSPESITNGEAIDLSKSLGTFVMIFNKNKQMVASPGTINGQKPQYPIGVLAYATHKGEDRVTWQPQKGLRFATVAIKTSNGYIVAAHSLYETEKLIDDVGKLVLFAWVAFLVFSMSALAIIYPFVKKIL